MKIVIEKQTGGSQTDKPKGFKGLIFYSLEVHDLEHVSVSNLTEQQIVKNVGKILKKNRKRKLKSG